MAVTNVEGQLGRRVALVATAFDQLVHAASDAVVLAAEVRRLRAEAARDG